MGEDADASQLDPQSLASLGCLVSLRKLNLTVGDVPTLLPYLTGLSELSDLDLTSHYTMTTDLSIAAPEFSHLCGLHHLTSLSWWGSDDCSGDRGMSFHPSTLPAICSCTQLVRLYLCNHVVKSEADIMLLASMPLLKHLMVRKLQPKLHIVVPGCSWERLNIRDFLFRDLARLPLSGIKLLISSEGGRSPRCLGTWELGSGRVPDAVAAAADDVHAAALVLDRAYDARGLKELALKWSEVPPYPAAAVIAGISPLGKHLTTLNLLNWCVDPKLLQQLAEAVPLLQRMALVGCSLSSETCWPAFLPLTSLSKVEFLGTLVTSDKFADFAASVERNMTIRIDKESMQEAEFIDCERALESEKRKALGLGREFGIVKFVRI